MAKDQNLCGMKFRDTKKAKEFENSINSIFTKKQLETRRIR